ncbi:DUF397 domain-containing protein [Streptomyces sp. ActVer]|uniref:DUF397 domain-containing protein n=1 Tax=Streptomyces sp. ActVer TaxID=3014558 RepID=UPI0022B41B71|nr:DUF397 domain-containing protein [Streptomyces sp. ActVer]MCZ4509350.1 DUF397 domain-containing protein [Streptomyces sp. ActVer]
MRATPDLSAALWRKSSYSGGQQGDACVEVAESIPALVPVRDSKTPLAPVLAFTPDVWGAFITAVKNGAAPTV